MLRRWTASAAVLLAVVSGTVVSIVATAPTADAAQRVVTYSVATRGAVRGDVGELTRIAEQTLRDPRGWALGGTIEFRRVPSGGDFSLLLAAPAAVAAAAPVCSAAYSCRVGRDVLINDDRWRLASPSWTAGLREYRSYVILHEVGHWLGLGHESCRGPGRSAPVMQQQSISLQGCTANVWPLVAERDRAAVRQGVRVGPTLVERRYRELGADRGIMGPATSWEQPAGVAAGVFQRFRNGEIDYTPATGAHEVYGAIVVRYRAVRGLYGPLGFPTSGELATPDGRGRYNAFIGSGGSAIYWTPTTGAHEVYGSIFDRYAQLGYENGRLGYPVTGEFAIPGGRRSNFERGYIEWSPTSGIREVITR